MVRRDPQTGQFVSGSGSKNWTDMRRVGGVMTAVIPAADMGGTTDDQGVKGPGTELIDFTGLLENDEVYEVHAADITATFHLPTTATAESSGTFDYEIGTEPTPHWIVEQTGAFYTGNVEHEREIVDFANHSEEMGSVIHVGNLVAHADAGDSTNGLGLGGDVDRERIFIDFEKTGRPVYDRDDELYAPGEFTFDNISDHAMRAQVTCLLHGEVQSLD